MSIIGVNKLLESIITSWNQYVAFCHTRSEWVTCVKNILLIIVTLIYISEYKYHNIIKADL